MFERWRRQLYLEQPFWQNPSVIFFTVLAILIPLVAILSYPYFSTATFHAGQQKYSLMEKTEGQWLYQGNRGSVIKVQSVDGTNNRSVVYGGDTYLVQPDEQQLSYSVTYPDKASYSVSRAKNSLLYFEDDHLFYMDQVSPDSYYRPAPSHIVTIAYPVFHEKQGMPWLLVVALLLVVHGWSTYRFTSYQTLLFWLSLRWVGIENPEPSDSYYTMTSLSGYIFIAVGIVAAVLAFYTP